MSSSVSSIVIERMIIHRLDHQTADKAELFEEISPLDPQSSEFLIKHIVESRGHRRSRHGKFIEPATNLFEQIASQMYANISDVQLFIDCSREIAERLFTFMKPKPRSISPGDLVICLYKESESDPEPTLGILKLDPKSGFRGVPVTINGKKTMKLVGVGNVLPIGDLQKCAFIVPPSLRLPDSHDLIVLDQQAKRIGQSRRVASFFSEKFLRCSVDYNRVEVTQNFWQQSLNWGDSQTDWNKPDRRRFEERIYQAITGLEVDVESVANETLDSPYDRRMYIRHLKANGVPDNTFEPDPAKRAALTDFVVYEGDQQLQLRIRRSMYNDPDIVLRQESDDGYIITIRTSLWRRK